ncbi:DUF1295 domain-containing protein [Paenibacillus oryzisoli]|uniref:Uncharacterized protein n=1 Tax=Paenibacillus oryzisoli TaxID=1850517 RepID=A0A198A5I9_9BACL|nr:DUF1295 domain-containing protein [Paenibacillus oryzisoli]OAS16744.1 hypothetical protein A8708_07715 [Paenibacillus oryzisoli]
MWVLYGISGVAVFIFMSLLFFIAQVKKDNSIVDIGWGLGFVIIALTTFMYQQGYDGRQLLITILVCIWGIRLAVYLFIRSIGRGEDYRYANFRKQWGSRAVLIAFFRVFMMQGFIMLLLAYPIIRVHSKQMGAFDLTAYLGLAVWIVGFMFQTIGDWQLRQFKKNRRNQEEVLTSGLWRYTRHPNYFGEAVMWWGIALIVLPLPGGWGALISSLLINLLLIKVSGVPFLDRRYANNLAYQQYKRETNRFLPWFPRIERR